jgi:N-acyl-phosphatidylethanolamine-hydrolysing phospholipase D
MRRSKNQPYNPKKKKFYNPHIEDAKRTIKDAFLWKVGYFNDPNDETKVPSAFIPPEKKDPLDPSLPSATWINHSTYLIKAEGQTILTDPIWGKRCSPLNFLGPLRKHTPPLALEELGEVDHVLISHNHYDHLDRKTVLNLHRLYPNIQWWVPLGVKKWFKKLGISQVEEFGWWEDHTFISPKDSSLEITLTAVPTQHFSGRTARDSWTTLWVGWVMELTRNSKTKRLYFVGDTGYNDFDFKAIGEKWPHMDLSLIPIGTYVPRKFMSPVHIDPESAVKIHMDVSSKQSLGMHWGTFNLSDEDTFRPPYDLFLALEKEKIDPLQFLAVLPGKEVNW